MTEAEVDWLVALGSAPALFVKLILVLALLYVFLPWPLFASERSLPGSDLALGHPHDSNAHSIGRYPPGLDHGLPCRVRLAEGTRDAFVLAVYSVVGQGWRAKIRFQSL